MPGIKQYDARTFYDTILFMGASFSADEKRILVTSDASEVLNYSKYSRNGRFRVTGINADARTEIRVHDEQLKRPVALPGVPSGDITGVEISKSGKRMAFYVDGDTSSANLHLLDIGTGEHRRLTRSLNPVIDERHLVNAVVVRYASYDGLEIPALLQKPHGASKRRKAPAIVYVHGGPGGQTRHGYSTERQFLVNHGYAVLSVNHRGSDGYGKTFYHMDDKRHGDVDLKDCIWGRKYLESLEWVDRSQEERGPGRVHRLS